MVKSLRISHWAAPLALAIAGFVAVSAGGQATDGAGVSDQPLRELAGEDAKAFNAVGRVDMDGAGFCTGALISPRLVLTAAHCLYYKDTGGLIPPEKISFRAGWRDGAAVAIRDARRVIVHENYQFTSEDKLRRVATDIALVELGTPIDSSIARPFESFDSPQPGDAVMVVSYAKDREDAPSLQERCHMLAGQNEVLVYSCDVNYGASGSPIFVMSNAQPKIASVVSAMAQWREQDVALGASLGPPLTVLLNRLATSAPSDARPITRPVATAAAPKRRQSIAEQLGRSGSEPAQRRFNLPQIK